MQIIGAGRVGQALAARAAAAGIETTLISRDEGWQALEVPAGAPILVLVRNDDLRKVVQRVPRQRRQDLVLVQNGMIRPLLQELGIAGCSRGLLYFAVRSRGGPVEPGGTSPFCGAHAQAMVAFFTAIGLDAHEVEWHRFSAWELEKLIWNSAFGLLCEFYGTSVGQVCTTRYQALRSLVTELRRVGRAGMGVDLDLDWLLTQLCNYSATIPDYQGKVGEFPYRNGWFLETARTFGVATPFHEDLLEKTGHLPAGA